MVCCLFVVAAGVVVVVDSIYDLKFFFIEFEIYIEKVVPPIALYALLKVDFSFQNHTVGP